MNLPADMNVVVVEGGHGPAEALRLDRAETPRPGPGEILIEVRASGVNRPDLLQRMGAYPPPPGAPDVLGLEVAGVVRHAAGRWSEGQAVCALVGGGGYAGYVAVDARHALPIPTGWSFEAAAGLPETVFTVYANVFEHGGLEAGETLLVHGATSGIGVMAIQMAKAAGARVIATARGAEKAQAARNLGADIAVNVLSEDFAERASQAGGVDVVLDMVGGDYFGRELDCLKHGGRIVFIAAQGGQEVSLPIFTLMRKQAVITGSTLRSRLADEKARLAQAIEQRVWPWIDAGKVCSQLDRAYPMSEAGKAHAYLEAGAHVGKVVLTPVQDP